MSEHLLLVSGLSDEVTDELSGRGYEVETAPNGYRSIELAERGHHAIAVFKADLPGPKAPDLVARLKLCGVKHVVVLVEVAEAERDVELLHAGADGILAGDHGASYLVWALGRIDDGGAVLTPEVARELLDALTEGVTLRGRWGRELAERTRQAEESARAKSDFLSNVSHELRTPLTIIKGVAATIRGTGPQDERSEMLEQMEHAADKLTLMIESIITYASMERGEYSVNARPADLAAVIREAAEEAANGYGNISLELLVGQEVPAVADARAIRGVVRQLVDNACRYSDPGGVVTVKARLGDEGLTVHVTDRGVGIDREKIAQALAEAFSPGEDIMRKERAGMGLGLNLSRNLIALHGGILWAEPLPGGGTRVSFTIPPDAGKPVSNEAQPAAEPAREPSVFQFE